MKTRVTIGPDKRRPKKGSKYFPVKVRVYHPGHPPQLYTTIYEVTEDEFTKIEQAKNPGTRLQNLRESFERILQDARTCIDDLSEFDFGVFHDRFIQDHPLFKVHKRTSHATQNVSPAEKEFDFEPYRKKFPALFEDSKGHTRLEQMYVDMIRLKILLGKVSTASSYHCALVSLRKYGGRIDYPKITVLFLHQYDKYQLSIGNKKSTVGIYLRTLRCLFNEAIDKGYVRKRDYPFGKKRYIIKKSKKAKQALPTDDVQKLYNATPLTPGERKAKAFWFFSYFGNGMNPKDIALLKYSNIQGDILEFVRAKTEDTSEGDILPIKVFLCEEMLSTIREYGNADRSPNNYIFPVLQPGLTPLRTYELIQQFLQTINRNIETICQREGIDMKVTNKYARHTYATTMKRSGVDPLYIKDSLGHEELSTLNNYLDSFENNAVRENAKVLHQFKKQPA